MRISDWSSDVCSSDLSVDIIRQAGAEPAAVLIALDRMERAGPDQALSAHSAVQDVSATYGIPVVSIASLADIMMLLDGDASMAEHRDTVAAYRADRKSTRLNSSP